MILAAVILPILDAFLGESFRVTSALFLILLFPPFADDFEHGSLSSPIFVTKGWMMEYLQDLIDHVVNVLLLVLPGIHDEWSSEADCLGSDTTGNFVQDIRKMIFGKHRMGRVVAVIVFKDEVLTFLGSLEDAGRASSEFRLDLMQNGEDVRSQQREDINLKSALQVLDDISKEGNLI
jgi:hypothetical protein